MRLHTPVVISNNPVAINAAHSRGWKVLQQDGQRIWFPGAAGVAPEPEMRIQNKSLEEPAVLGWDSVLRFIVSKVHNPMLVIETGHPLSELVLWAQRVRSWPHGVLVVEEPPSKNVEALALVSSAQGFFLPGALNAEHLRDFWAGPVLELPDTPLVPVEPHSPPPVVRRRSGVTRVLLVAYYAGASSGVSVQRPNYWFEEMEKLAGGTVTVDVAVAVSWPDAPDRVHVVPDLGSATISEKGPLEPWAQNVAELSRANGHSFTQQAAFWAYALEEYFDDRRDDFDVVVITGNPFPPFEFARYAKRRWYAATVLDYRDPFSMNPRAAMSDAAHTVARYVEVGWNHMADIVTTVNERCAEWVQADPQTRIEVIRNGFDERDGLPELVAEREAGRIRFAHAGRFYGISPPDEFIRALSTHGAELHQLGSQLDYDGPTVRNRGSVPRGEVVPVLTGMDCGVTFSSELGFETPTKVFDYLAAGLDILILYRGNPAESALAEMLDGVRGVHWVVDDEATIGSFLSEYTPTRHLGRERRLRFSRSASTTTMLDLVRELADHSFPLSPPE